MIGISRVAVGWRVVVDGAGVADAPTGASSGADDVRVDVAVVVRTGVLGNDDGTGVSTTVVGRRVVGAVAVVRVVEVVVDAHETVAPGSRQATSPAPITSPHQMLAPMAATTIKMPANFI